MFNKLKYLYFAIFVLAFSFLTFASPILATEKFNKSLKATGENSGYTIVTEGQAATSIYATIATVIKVILGLVGVVFIILIIYAGYTWMLARGNETEAQKAKDVIMRAIIGLGIILAAYAITSLVGNNLT